MKRVDVLYFDLQYVGCVLFLSPYINRVYLPTAFKSIYIFKNTETLNWYYLKNILVKSISKYIQSISEFN